MQAEIYTKTICPFCTRAKAMLNEKGIPYKEYIISAGINEKPLEPHQLYVTRDVLLDRLPTATMVPQIWLDDQHIGGYDDLVAHFEENTQ
jgi:glutaredoxin 3